MSLSHLSHIGTMGFHCSKSVTAHIIPPATFHTVLHGNSSMISLSQCLTDGHFPVTSFLPVSVLCKKEDLHLVPTEWVGRQSGLRGAVIYGATDLRHLQQGRVCTLRTPAVSLRKRPGHKPSSTWAQPALFALCSLNTRGWLRVLGKSHAGRSVSLLARELSKLDCRVS